MALIAKQAVDRDGLTISFTAASAGGDTAEAADDSVLLVRNDDAGPHTVTMVTPKTVEGLPVDDLAVTVAAGDTAALRLGPRDVFADADGIISVTYDAVTAVTVAVLSV